jgi:hypothetical protein
MELICLIAVLACIRGGFVGIRRAHAVGHELGRQRGYADGYERGLHRGARISAEHYAAELEAMNVEAIVRHAEGLPPLTYRLTYEGDVLTTSPILEPT